MGSNYFYLHQPGSFLVSFVLKQSAWCKMFIHIPGQSNTDAVYQCNELNRRNNNQSHEVHLWGRLFNHHRGGWRQEAFTSNLQLHHQMPLNPALLGALSGIYFAQTNKNHIR